MSKTKIEWSSHVWNSIVGCSIESTGCKNCYAMRMASRIAGFGNPEYQGLTEPSKRGPVWTGIMRQGSLAARRRPYAIKGAQLIFVNSMSDLFHPDAKDEWRDEAFATMRDVDRHTYQILTKRPEIAAAYYAARPHLHGLPNVWLGVSVEDGDHVHRIETLRHIPAAVRFISFEPLLGSVGDVDLTGISWSISGGESGPRARPCPPAAIREIHALCRAQGVAHFLKQFGTYASNPLVVEQGMSIAQARAEDPHGKGGSLLDGEQIREYPA